MYFFPTEETASGKYLKYHGKRDLESLTKFAVGGGYIDYYEEEPVDIPREMTGYEIFKVYFRRGLKLVGHEIDYFFFRWDLHHVVTKDLRYTVVAILFAFPFILLAVLVFCLNDNTINDEINEEQQNKTPEKIE